MDLLARVLHRELAYGIELMPPGMADSLARNFLGSFRNDGSRFYSNGTLAVSSVCVPDKAWSAATPALFDTGVLILGSEHTACAWFADDD